MSLLLQKVKSVLRALLPLLALVLLLALTAPELPGGLLARFLLSCLALLVGLSLFLWGLSLAIHPMGEQLARESAASTSPVKIALLGFLLGFLSTVVQPGLWPLGTQIGQATGGVLSAPLLVLSVSAGVGVMVALSVFRLLRDRSLSFFLLLTFGVMLLLSRFVKEGVLALAFRTAGTALGALTPPFLLALALGLAQAKGGRSAEKNAFGMVGAALAGAVLPVLLLGMLTGVTLRPEASLAPALSEGVLRPFGAALPSLSWQVALALLPLGGLFFLFNHLQFHLSRERLAGIGKGLGLTVAGLWLFLLGVRAGLLDLLAALGGALSGIGPFLPVAVGLLLGPVIVRAEPAVHVLGEQIEQATSGHIPQRLVRATLAAGVGLSLALALLRVAVPEVRLWYFLLPGVALAVWLSFRADPIFVGIAYDAGGVAVGPLTAAALLAFVGGAAGQSSSLLWQDTVGVLALTALLPVLSLMAVGTAWRRGRPVPPPTPRRAPAPAAATEPSAAEHVCLAVAVRSGLADRVVSVARGAGAVGATILRGRGGSEQETVRLPLLHLELHPKKELVLFVVPAGAHAAIADSLPADPILAAEGGLAVFLVPAEAMAQTLAAPPVSDHS
ncbi:MAG: DUF1538 family protein [Eubacteriales bacterium]